MSLFIYLSVHIFFHLLYIVYYIMQLVGESREHEPFINNEEDTPSNNVSLMKFLVFLMKEVNMCVSLPLILSLYPLSESFNTLSLPPSLSLSLSPPLPPPSFLSQLCESCQHCINSLCGDATSDTQFISETCEVR